MAKFKKIDIESDFMKKLKININQISYPTIFLIILLIVAVLLFIVAYFESKYVTVCTRESIVEDILSINYRSADILLENGMTITVNQATLAPGDDWCLSSHRIHKKKLKSTDKIKKYN